MWPCLVWAERSPERSTLNSFWVPSHRFNSAPCEQKGITQTIYTDSEPHSLLPNSLMPSAKIRSATSQFLRRKTLRLWCVGRGSNPGLPHPSGRSTHYATQGRSLPNGHLVRSTASGNRFSHPWNPCFVMTCHACVVDL